MPKEMDIFQMYIRELSDIRDCSREENAALALRAAAGDAAAKTRLIEGNLKYVLNLSRNYLSSGIAAGDLVQEANMALVMAAETCSGMAEEQAFEDFLERMVKDALRLAIARHESESEAGRAVLERVNRLQEVSRIMAEELGREATVPELARRLRVTEDEVKDTMKIALDALHVLGGAEIPTDY